MVKTGEIGASATVAPRPGTELDDSRRRGGYPRVQPGAQSPLTGR